MALKKLDPNEINWKTPNTLYRGDVQWKFEFVVLKSMLNGTGVKNASYWGAESRTQGKLTFGTKTLCDTIYFTQPWMDYKQDSEIYTFTHSPLILEIDASKYDLYKSDDGEGLVINEPVSLDDITVLYSSRKNNLNEIPQCMIDELNTKRPFTDLFNFYEKNPAFVEGYIEMALNTPINGHNINDYITRLRSKLE